MAKIKILIASDHAGFELKSKIMNWLKEKGFNYEDIGPFEKNPDDDYPDYAKKVAERISKDKTKSLRGVLICGSGVGMSIAANRYKGVRAVAAYDSFTAKGSREHNDTNVITLRARKFLTRYSIRILSSWLSTPFSGGERHIRRIKKMEEI